MIFFNSLKSFEKMYYAQYLIIYLLFVKKNSIKEDNFQKVFQKGLIRVLYDLIFRGRVISAPPFRRRRLGAADSALDNSTPCRFGAGHFGAVS